MDDDNVVTTEATPHGVFRARIVWDEYAEAPDFDAGCPVYGYEYRAGSVDVDDAPRYGTGSDKRSGVDFRAALMHFYDRADRFSEAVEHTDRWLRVFHGGSLAELRSMAYQGDPYYLAYDTRAMREWWGQTGDALDTSDPEATEWQAYIDGDVYGWVVERAREFDDDGEPTDWTELDSCWGYYGQRYAEQAATEALRSEIDSAAADMLPLAQ